MSLIKSQALLRHLMWLGASFILAFLVLVVAKIQADPVIEEPFSRIPIQLTPDDGVIITNDPSRVARVFVRAPSSVVNLLVSEDITVSADLEGLGAGTHNVPLVANIARNSPASFNTQPAQVTVTLALLESRLKPVHIDTIQPPPNLAFEMTNQSIQQATVSGSPDQLATVAEVVGTLNLSNVTGSFESNLDLRAVDSDGNAVEDVTIEPAIVSVDVDISQREDTREVAVRPVILFDTIDENFEFRNLTDWEPRTVIINGSPEALAELGNTVDTEPITLAGRTSDFTVDVALALPDDDFVILSGESMISVEIEISEQLITLPLENIEISAIGLADGFEATITPEIISVVLNGPISLLDGVTVEDVQAVIDLNGLEPDTHDIAPRISVNGQIVSTENVTILPQRVTVILTAPVPEATDEATAEATEAPTND